MHTNLHQFYFIFISLAYGMQLKSLEDCDKTKFYPISSMMKLKNNVITDAIFNYTEPLRNFPFSSTVRMSSDGKSFTKLGILKDRDICGAINKFLRELWFDIQRVAGMSNPGVCPIRKGVYTIKNAVIDNNKIPRVPAQHGSFEVITKIYTMDKMKEIGCSIFRFEN